MKETFQYPVLQRIGRIRAQCPFPSLHYLKKARRKSTSIRVSESWDEAYLMKTSD